MYYIYGRIGRFLYIFLKPFIKIYFTVFKAERVRIVVFVPDNNQVLLVKSWLSGQRWELPGGRIERDETPLQSAVRELKEETGINVNNSELKHLGRVKHETDIGGFKAEIFTCSLQPESNNKFSGRRWEIIDSGLFHIEKLPTETDYLVRRVLLRLVEQPDTHSAAFK